MYCSLVCSIGIHKRTGNVNIVVAKIKRVMKSRESNPNNIRPTEVTVDVVGRMYIILY